MLSIQQSISLLAKHSQSAVKYSMSALCAVFLLACQAENSAHAVDSSKYEVINKPYNSSTGDKIEVNEFFMFTCPHCYALEPLVQKWQNETISSKAKFVKVPAVFNSAAEKHAKAYYTMEILGLLPQALEPFFKKIHGEHKHMTSLEELVALLAQYGKSAQQVSDAYNSFAVDNKLRNAKSLTAKSGIRAVPSFVVDGKYRTSAAKAGSSEELFPLLNELANKAASER